MFLANMLSKMKRDTRMDSCIAAVHNGSSLFTGDAGQGETNIRRWIIENDWLEAIVALPLNMFYMELVQEYRTRLIADVVTDKLDVREAAAQLPEQADEEDSIDEDGLMLDNVDDGSYDASQPTEEEPEMESEVTV